MNLILCFFVTGVVLLAIGIYQMKTYYSQPHEQEAKIVGFSRYHGKNGGLSGFAIDSVATAAGLKHPVVEITLDDGTLHYVPLNIAVDDNMLRTKFPELDLGGSVTVLYFGKKPKMAFLQKHPMAQTIIKSNFPLLFGIASVVFSVILLVVYITAPSQ